MDVQDRLVELLSSPPVGGGMLVAVSGGPDSAVLAHLCARSRVRRGVVLVSVDHGLRSEEERRAERAAVESLATRLCLPHHRLSVGNLPVRQGGPVPEGRAREARYRVLAEHARSLRIPLIVTGHHASDQEETQVLQLLRGGTLRALRGMRSLRRLEDRWLWRPLLEVGRERLRDIAARERLPFVHDSSNSDLRISRNRLRAAWARPNVSELDPLHARLSSLRGLADRALERIEARLDARIESARVPTPVPGTLLLARSVLTGIESRSLAHYLLERMLERVGARPRSRERERALDLLDPRSAGTARTILSERELGRDAAHLWLRPRAAPGPAALRLEPGERIERPAAGWWVERLATSRDPARTVVLRLALPGDRLQRRGRRRRLVDWFREHGVLAFERAWWPVLVAGEDADSDRSVRGEGHAGEILWVPGLEPAPDGYEASPDLSVQPRRRGPFGSS